MSLGEHLEELRRRLLRGLAAVALAFVVAWIWQDPITSLVLRPYDRAMTKLEAHWVAEAEEHLAADPGRPRTDFFESADPEDHRLRGLDARPQATAPGESFFFVLQICLYSAVFAGSPFLLWQVWGFVSAGLYRRERRAVLLYFPVSLLLFLAGVLFGYFAMVPYAIYFLNQGVPITLVRPDIKVDAYLTFLSGLCLALGVVFQLPVLMSFLGLSGLVEPATMARYRGYFLIGAFVLAAVLTPPDPFTQVLLGLPMVLLYELGIWCARLAARRSGRSADPVGAEGR